MSWLDEIFALFPAGRSGEPAPLERTGNTYKGKQLPHGASSLRASSLDRKPRDPETKKKVARGPSNPETGHISKKDMNSMSREANGLLQGLFGDYERVFPGQAPPPDQFGDELLDLTDFFNPWSGTVEERQQRVKDEWTRRVYGQGIAP